MAKAKQTPDETAADPEDQPMADPAAETGEAIPPIEAERPDGSTIPMDETSLAQLAASRVIDARQSDLKRISVRRAFQGAATGENLIVPGTYWPDDPALHGMADFLVANQYADWI